jgi:hypothetical protein
MGFRPGHIRSSWVGMDTGSGSSNPVVWQHSFFPINLRSDGILQDSGWANLILLNEYHINAPPQYVVCQGFLHPYYDSGDVTLSVSINMNNTVSIHTLLLEGSIRAWGANAAINQTLSPFASASIPLSVNPDELVRTKSFVLNKYGEMSGGNAFQARINWTSIDTLGDIDTIGLCISYNLSKFYA